MSALTALLLIILAALLAVLARLFLPRAPTADAAAEATIRELRGQLGQVQARAEEAGVARTAALERAAAAEATAVSATRELTETKAAGVDALHVAEARYVRDIQALKESFSKMSTDVLQAMAPNVTNEVTTKVAPLIAQVNAALESYRKSMQQGLQTQDAALAQVREQMSKISETTTTLATSTNDFTAVLKSSQHRGKWGEQTLRRVVEASGLSELCDFSEQVTEGDSRPDLIVKLPGKRCIIIDSKVPDFEVAIADQAAPNRREIVAAHAKKLLGTIKSLAARNYATALKKDGQIPFDKVILFLPAESLLSTALEGDNDLVLKASDEGILLATPATLMGFLGAINLTWQQHTQAENAAHIAEHATELYDRVRKFVDHLGKLQKHLHGATTAFNDAVGSYTRRVRPQGEKLREIGAIGRPELDELEPIEKEALPAPGADTT
ncbi:MAG: DNA recombination protein RmuC [Vicinamibacterales bacterium]